MMAEFDSGKEYDDSGTNLYMKSKAGPSRMGSEFDFCDNSDGVKSNTSAEGLKNQSGSSSISSDYDLIKELDDVLSLGTNFSAKSTSHKAGSSNPGSDVDLEDKMDDVQILVGTDSSYKSESNESGFSGSASLIGLEDNVDDVMSLGTNISAGGTSDHAVFSSSGSGFQQEDAVLSLGTNSSVEGTRNKTGFSIYDPDDVQEDEFDDVLSLGTNFSAGSPSNKARSSSSGFDVFQNLSTIFSAGCTINKVGSSSSCGSYVSEDENLDDVLRLFTKFSAGSTSKKAGPSRSGSKRSHNAFSGFSSGASSSTSEIHKRRCEIRNFDKFIPDHRKAHILVSEYPNHVMKLKQEMNIKDIIKQEALCFLPAKSLARFKSVSREWNSWISSPLLSLHQSYSFQDLSGYFKQRIAISFVSLCRPAYGIPSPSLEFLPEAVLIRSASNGLLLCQGKDTRFRKYYVCNPANKEWKQIPNPNSYHGEDTALVLAYEPSSFNIIANYMIICAVRMLDHPFFLFETYSSETNSWKVSDALCVELPHESLKKTGFFFNGLAYWETSSNELLAFDFKTDFEGIVCSLPQNRSGGVLAGMNGEICYICARNRCGSVFAVDIYGGMGMHLKQSVSFDLGIELRGDTCKILPCVKDDIVMILVEGLVFSCGLKDQKVEVKCEVLELELDSSYADYIPYVNSLVSLG